jgi:hypothetical protein
MCPARTVDPRAAKGEYINEFFRKVTIQLVMYYCFAVVTPLQLMSLKGTNQIMFHSSELAGVLVLLAKHVLCPYVPFFNWSTQFLILLHTYLFLGN